MRVPGRLAHKCRAVSILRRRLDQTSVRQAANAWPFAEEAVGGKARQLANGGKKRREGLLICA